MTRVLIVLVLSTVAGCSCAGGGPRRGSDSGPGGDDTGGSNSDAAATRDGGADLGLSATDTGGADTGGADTGSLVDAASCASPTQVTGTTYAPNRMDPLPGVLVAMVPDTQTFDPGPTTVQCQVCVAGVPGAIAGAISGPNGTFTLTGPALDAGGTYTLVIMSGGFRRVVRRVTVPACGMLALMPAQTSLPGASSGDDVIPRIAVASATAGDVNDKFAHVLDLIGITGYERFAPNKNGVAAGPMDMISLFSDAATLNQYQIVIAPCGVLGNFAVTPNLTGAMVTNLEAWLAAGGRLYASDLAYQVIARPFAAAITFAPGPSPHVGPPAADPADVGQGIATAASIMATVDDMRLLAWLQLVGAVPAGSSRMPISYLRDPWAAIDLVPPMTLMPDARGVHHAAVLVSADVTWHGAGAATVTGHHPLTVQADYPSATGGGYCGRVVFTSYHVQTGTGTTLSPQERVLEYLFFQLSTCIQNGPS